MATSLESRAPFLDHRLVEFSWRLPRELKLRGTVGKWITRELLYTAITRSRPKSSVPVPPSPTPGPSWGIPMLWKS